MSPSIFSLYFTTSEYGGWVHIKSILSFLNKFKCLASCFFMKIELLSFTLCLQIFNEFSLISEPIHILFSLLASIKVVPLPTNWSNTTSPSFEYLNITFLGTWGLQFPG